MYIHPAGRNPVLMTALRKKHPRIKKIFSTLGINQTDAALFQIAPNCRTHAFEGEFVIGFRPGILVLIFFPDGGGWLFYRTCSRSTSDIMSHPMNTLYSSIQMEGIVLSKLQVNLDSIIDPDSSCQTFFWFISS